MIFHKILQNTRWVWWSDSWVWLILFLIIPLSAWVWLGCEELRIMAVLAEQAGKIA